MKASVSKDGLPRFTLRVPHRVGASDLINGLGWVLARDCSFDSPLPPKQVVEAALKPYRSRKAIIQATMAALASDGQNIWTWSDELSHEKEIRDQARALVYSKFPELQPQPKPTP